VCACTDHTPLPCRRYGNPPGTKTLAEGDRYTGDYTCFGDAINAGAGHKIIPDELSLRVQADPLIRLSIEHPEVRATVHAAGYHLQAINKDGGGTFGLTAITGQLEGSFVVVFKTNVPRDPNGLTVGHCILVDCHRRIAFCNTKGVFLFTMGKSQETHTTHKTLKAQLAVGTITHVYRLLQLCSTSKRMRS